MVPLLAAWPALAAANGSVIAEVEGSGTVRSAAFRAVYVIGAEPGTTTAVVQTAYVGMATGFAWVYPLPAPVVDGRLDVVPAGEVAALLAHTDPQVVVWEAGACGSKSGDAADSGATQGAGVTVLGEYDAGPYDVLELSAAASADLSGWLLDQRYAVDAATEPLLDLYADEGWSFLVVTLRDATPAEEPRGLPALAFTYGSEEPVYPLRISVSSTSEEVETVLITMAPDRMEPQGDAVFEPELPEGYAGEDFATWYRERLRLLQARTEAERGVRAWALENGGGGAWEYLPLWDALIDRGLVSSAVDRWAFRVTRYHAWRTPAQMDRDVRFVPARDQTYTDLVIGRTRGGCALESAPQVLLGTLLVGGLGLSRRRSRRP